MTLSTARPFAITSLALLVGVSAADQPKSPIQAGKVWQVHVTLSAKEYEAIQPRPAPRSGLLGLFGPAKPEKKEEPARAVHRNTFGMDLPWATGTVTLDGQTFADIGIRYKGNGTIGDAARTIKKSVKLDLDRNGGEGRFQGLKTINLHCGAADPSKCRETLCYAIYRAAGVPAPRTCLAEVTLTVPGKYDRELLGLYTVTEEVEKAFLREHFGSDKGLLMKPEGVRDIDYRGDDWSKYEKQYKPKREAMAEEGKRVVAFAKLVDKATDEQFRLEIGSFLDADAYLRYLAATAYVSNSDSFFVTGHNYYLYLHPKTGRFHFMPWDLDRAMSNLPFLGSNKQQMDLSFNHPYAGAHKLTDRLLAVPGMKERYQTLLKELSIGAFEKQRLLKQVEVAEAAVQDLLARDVKAAAARKDNTGGFAMFGKPPTLKTFIDKRNESLTAQLAGTSKGYAPTGGGPGGFKVGDMIAGPMLETLDTNKDGLLSLNEWIAGAKKVYDASEKDAQQTINEKGIIKALNDMIAKPPDGQPGGGFSPGHFLAGPIVRRADADKDGKLTWEEMQAAAAKTFADFDKGKTGHLDDSTFGELLNDLFRFPGAGPPAAKPNELKK